MMAGEGQSERGRRNGVSPGWRRPAGVAVMRHTAWLLCLVLLAGCPVLRTPKSKVRRTPEIRYARTPAAGIHHVVRRGDTLWGIGRVYGVGFEQIAVLNGIANPDRLKVGARLFIPGAARARLVPRSRRYQRPAKPRPRWASPPPRKRRGAAQRKTRRRAHAHRPPRFSWPLRGRVIRRFGARGGKKADGILIAARERAKVRASARGRVIFSDFGPGNLGRLIILRHRGGEYHSIYAHIAKNLVRKGQVVSRGTPIALAGRTRRFRSARLHFEIRHRTRPRNPLSYLPRGR